MDDVELEALERSPNVDVIITDLLMPGMSGRARNRAGRRGVTAPIIVLTGYSDSEADSRELANLGAVMLKPFAPAKLFALIEDRIGERSR